MPPLIDLYIIITIWLLYHAIRHGRNPKFHPARTSLTFLAIGIGFPFILMTFVTGPFFASILLAIVFPMWRLNRPESVRFWPVAASIITITYATIVILNLGTWRTLVQQRKEFPLASVAARVPLLPALPNAPPLSKESQENLGAIERSFGMHSRRNRFLSDLHQHIVQLFISSPGFGFMRAPDSFPNATELMGSISVGGQPAKDRTAPLKDEWRGTPVTLFEMHVRDDEDFVNPDKMGYFEDRDHVVGFLPHTQSYAVDLQGAARIDSVLLVGLLNHSQPVVYLSDNLPSLQNVKTARTRQLDTFEATALETLKRGAETTRNDGPTLTMAMGALRNAVPCMKCHGGTRGQLLGAFSYRFSPRPK